MKYKYLLLSAEMGVQEQDEISYKNHKESHFIFMSMLKPYMVGPTKLGICLSFQYIKK